MSEEKRLDQILFEAAKRNGLTWHHGGWDELSPGSMEAWKGVTQAILFEFLLEFLRRNGEPVLHTENINLQATNEKLGDDVHMLKEENENLRNFIETNNGSAIALKKTALQALQENEELKKQLRMARAEEQERCKQRLSNIDAAKGFIQIAIKDCIKAIQALGDTE